ncbi:MAG TPA: RNA ligase family protein [Actinocrinis sp.]|nr:RNA ligase family protein [Actinocrinis sp.]
MRAHYPRTPHLPWSPGATSDDMRTTDLSGLRGREVVVTEKLDGENTTLYRDGLHARSLDSAHHPSRAWVKALQARIGPEIPPQWRVCGENVFARHSLAYQNLDSWFYGFSVWDGDTCLGWDRTVRYLHRLGVPTPRVLWRGGFDERALRKLRLDLSAQEGYVVRAVAEFERADFGARVAKWVRSGHVQTDVHWMQAAVVENGLGPASALWDVRSGAPADAEALAAAVGMPLGPRELIEPVLAQVSANLDELGRRGDARLAGVLAALLHDVRRARLAPGLAASVGMPLARRVMDLVGLASALHDPFPDEGRRAGLVRMSFAADLGVLHAVAGAVLAGHRNAAAEAAREQVEWSALFAEDAGLLGEDPFAALWNGLRSAFADLADKGDGDADVADRCWAETREAHARRPVATAEEAVAATWRWRSGEFPRLIHLAGPSGSGKSTFAARLTGVDTRISLDDLREARGSRADQRANREVLGEGVDRLDAALAKGGTVLWDTTSLDPRMRSLVHGFASRHNALVTHAVVLVGEDELLRRNAVRAHPVPPTVLAAQLRRFAPPYPGEAHRTWYIGASGTVEDADGVLGTLNDAAADVGVGAGGGAV